MKNFDEVVNQPDLALEVVDLGKITRFRVGMAWMELVHRNPHTPAWEERDDDR